MAADLSLLRLHPRDEAELRWFFQQAEGELGLQSSHAALVNACLGGRNKGSKPVGAARQFEVAEHRLKAAETARRVARRLGAISPRDLRTLAAAYGGVSLPRRTRADWTRLDTRGLSAELVYVTARRGRVPLADLRGVAGRQALSKLCGQARVDLAVASSAYEVAR